MKRTYYQRTEPIEAEQWYPSIEVDGVIFPAFEIDTYIFAKHESSQDAVNSPTYKLITNDSGILFSKTGPFRLNTAWPWNIVRTIQSGERFYIVEPGDYVCVKKDGLVFVMSEEEFFEKYEIPES